jgi:hypothetical protein
MLITTCSFFITFKQPFYCDLSQLVLRFYDRDNRRGNQISYTGSILENQERRNDTDSASLQGVGLTLTGFIFFRWLRPLNASGLSVVRGVGRLIA